MNKIAYCIWDMHDNLYNMNHITCDMNIFNDKSGLVSYFGGHIQDRVGWTTRIENSGI